MKPKPRSLVVLLLLVCAGVAYWHMHAPSGRPTDTQAGTQAGKPVPVVSRVFAAQEFVVQSSLTGTISALNTVDVRTQVASIVRKVHVREGAFVKAGQVLFSLDDRADMAALQKARAQLERDLASAQDARRQLVRSQELQSKKFLSPSALDSIRTQLETQEATVAADRAALEAARVSVSYSRIVAPMSGRLGVINVFPGSLVQPGSAVPLVSLTQMDPVAVSFALPQQMLGDALSAMQRGDGQVRVRMPDSAQERVGQLYFLDNQVDANAGTVKAKARLANPDMHLWPGAYVQVEAQLRTLKNVLVVPHSALVVSPQGTQVYLVQDGKAVLQAVQVRATQNGTAAIDGVAPGSRIIVEGKVNVRPGVAVREVDAQSAAQARSPEGGVSGPARAARAP